MRLSQLPTVDPDHLPRIFWGLGTADLAQLLGDMCSTSIGTKRGFDVERWAVVARTLLVSRPGIATPSQVARLVSRALRAYRAKAVAVPTRIALAQLVAAAMENEPDLSRKTLTSIGELFGAKNVDAELQAALGRLSTARTAVARSLRALSRQRLLAPQRTGDVDFRELDVAAAAGNLLQDATGDWYRDPWRWLEVNWLANYEPSRILSRIAAGVPGPAVALDVPKPGFGVRPATILSALDRLAYQSLVDSAAPRILARLPEWVHGWRSTRNGSVSRFAYASNGEEFGRLLTQRASLRAQYRYGLRTDVRGFFESFSPGFLRTSLASSGLASSATIDAICGLLSALETSARKGLPQRCLASSVLAHVALHPVDMVLERMRSQSFEVLRWMDDFELYSNNLYELEDALELITAQLSCSGLTLNAAKTFISEFPHTLLHVLDQESDEGADSDDIAAALGTKTEPQRFEVGRIVSTVSYTELPVVREQLARLLQERGLERLGYVADYLARLLCRTGQWVDYRGWYRESLARHPLRSDWVPHAWSRMFPQRKVPTDANLETSAYAERLVAGRMPFALLPTALTQVGRWRPQELADHCHLAASVATTPFELRAVGLAAATAGPGTAALARRWLDSSYDGRLARLALDALGPPPARTSGGGGSSGLGYS